MLKRRLIPKLQMRRSRADGVGRVLVTTIGFGRAVEIGDPVSQAKIYEAQAADELIFVDIDSQTGNLGALCDVVSKAAEQIFMPIAVGGGVRSVEDFRGLLANGADKVSVNTAAVETPAFIRQAADQFGAQCVVLSIDYRKDPTGKCSVWIKGGAVDTQIDPVAWAAMGEEYGAGEILLTSIDRDGSRKGLDLDVTRNVARNVSIPVITSGGCGTARHFVDGFTQGHADAVSAGTYFSFRDENPMQTRSQISNAGVPIRLHM